MKILLLQDYGTATGGAELQMLSLRRNLRDRGHDARLFSSRAMLVGKSPLLSDYDCFGSTGRLQVFSQTCNPSAYFNLHRVLQKFQPDVVHVRMFMWQLSPLILPLLKPFPCLYQTAVYKAICPLGTKTLPTGEACQSKAGFACIKSGCLTLQSWSVLMVQRQLWLRWRSTFDRVVALSQGMRQQLEAEGIHPVEVIHNGIAERPMRPKLQHPPMVAFAGRLVLEKGVAILLHAIAQISAQFPTLRVLIAGEGAEKSFLQDLAQSLGIRDRVTWLGHLPRAEMESQFDVAWVQVVPSVWEEPFGNVTTEAMMRGTAVIASEVGAQPEIIQDDVTGFLVPPKDIEALAQRLRQVLSNIELAEAMGQAGRQRAICEFSEARLTERFLALYQEIQRDYLQREAMPSYPRLT